MFKKICALVLSLSLALALTVGLGIHAVNSSEQSEVTMCDMPYVLVSD